jgi:hypothetical protein
MEVGIQENTYSGSTMLVEADPDDATTFDGGGTDDWVREITSG